MKNTNALTGTPRLVIAVALLLAHGLHAPAQSSANLRLFTNDTGIIIVDESVATPYPSVIDVSGLTGVLTRVQVTLRGLNHSYPDDLDMLLVAPGGHTTILMSDAGGTLDVSDAIIQFDDTAPPIPNSSQILSGTFAPANWAGDDDFSAPAPAGPYAAALGTLGGIDPNGIWSLYIFDDIRNNDGSIGDGWSLTISTEQALTFLTMTPTGETMRLSWPGTSPGYTLETTATPQSPPSWATATNAVTLISGEYRATISLSDPRRFFRLRK